MEARTVVVGADLASTGDQAIRAGFTQLATGVANELYVVHVLDTTRQALFPPEERPAPPIAGSPVVHESLTRRVRTLAKLDGFRYREEQVHIEVRSGDVLAALLDAISEHHATLAIVGTHGRRGLDRLLGGSVAETLVRSAECSVLVARSGRAHEGSVALEPGLHAERGAQTDGPQAEPAWRPTDHVRRPPTS